MSENGNGTRWVSWFAFFAQSLVVLGIVVTVAGGIVYYLVGQINRLEDRMERSTLDIHGKIERRQTEVDSINNAQWQAIGELRARP